MPLTHFPHGIATDADIIQTMTFSDSSAAQSTACYFPVKATIKSIVYVPVVASRVASLSVNIGSAGTTIVTSANTTSAAVGVPETLTLASAAVAAGETLVAARGTQGTAGEGVVIVTASRS